MAEVRRYDVAAFQGYVSPGEALLDPRLFTETSAGTALTGVFQVEQQVAIWLLTPRGSVRYRRDIGTSFARDLVNLRLRTEVDIRSSFAISVSEILNGFARLYPDDTPPDSRLADLALLQLTLAPGTMFLTIQVTTAAGDTRTPTLPVKALRAA